MYVLQRQTQISNQDLKSVAVHENILCTSSLDNKIHIFNLTTNKKQELQTETKISSLCIVKTSNLYVNDNKKINENDNSSTALDDTDNEYLICAGSQDGLILVYKYRIGVINNTNSNDNINIINDGMPPVYLVGHQKNVCSLQIQNNYLISTSWDHSVIIWDLQTNTQIKNHNYSCCVWSAYFLDTSNHSDFVAVNADKSVNININNNDTTILAHLAAVRSIKITNNIIYTIGNDGKIIKLSKTGKIIGIQDVKEFIYKMDIKNDKITVCGENGCVFILDLDLNVIDTIKVDSQSCWGCAFYGENIYVCGSNGNLYEFAVKEINKGDDKELDNKLKCDKANDENKINDDIGSNKVNDDVTSDKVDGSNYRIENGKMYYNENGSWNLIGDVIENNKQYDHTFDVEVDGKYLKINFNKNDNIYDVADKFLNDNQLSKNYKDDIVEFIKKNFKPKESFYVYDDINLKGIQKYMNDEFVIENLINTDLQNNEVIEMILKEKLQEENNFVVLDCYRFFVSRGFLFDFLFLQDYNTEDKKRATVFLRLIVNLYKNQPYNLEILSNKIKKIIDYKLADQGTIDNYKRNRELANK
ncbi:WD repeat protein Lub1 [Binucleata daphniae]